jgi:hypothetical protein
MQPLALHEVLPLWEQTRAPFSFLVPSTLARLTVHWSPVIEHPVLDHARIYRQRYTDASRTNHYPTPSVHWAA